MKNILALLLTFSILASTATAGGRSSSSSSSSSGRSAMSSSRSSSSGSSGKSFSAGRSSTPSGKSYSAPSKTTTTTPSKPTGKSFSGGSKPVSGTAATKSKSTYDQDTTRKYKEQESRAAYKEKFDKDATIKKGETTKTEYKNKQGKTVKIDPKDVKIERLKRSLDDHKWENRQLRMENTYQRYYAQPTLYPPVYYAGDHYNSVFWYWMLDRSLEERAMWAYCHRDDMDKERYRTLLAKDAQLEAKIEQLKSQHITVDPTYVPKGADLDTTYEDELVEAVYNPTPVHSEGVHVSWGWLCFGSTLIVLVLLLCFALFYRY